MKLNLPVRRVHCHESGACKEEGVRRPWMDRRRGGITGLVVRAFPEHTSGYFVERHQARAIAATDVEQDGVSFHQRPKQATPKKPLGG